MEHLKTYVFAFLVGGAYAAIGQGIIMLWTILCGPGFPFIMPLTLISMGVVAFIAYLTGLHQRIAPISGYGSILPFNGFACAVADCYKGVADAAGSASKGAGAAVSLVVYVVGVGGCMCVLIGIISLFIV